VDEQTYGKEMLNFK